MEPGRSNEKAPSGGLKFVYASARFVGFLLLAVPAMATLAALVLLPEYGQMKAKGYELDKVRTDNQSFRDYVTKQEDLLKQASEDEVLTMRLRISTEGLLPKNEVMVVDPNAPKSAPPGVIVPVRRAYPPRPTDSLLAMGTKIEDPNTRRGLFLLSAMALMAGMFLFTDRQEAEGKRQ